MNDGASGVCARGNVYIIRMKEDAVKYGDGSVHSSFRRTERKDKPYYISEPGTSLEESPLDADSVIRRYAKSVFFPCLKPFPPPR